MRVTGISNYKTIYLDYHLYSLFYFNSFSAQSGQGVYHIKEYELSNYCSNPS